MNLGKVRARQAAPGAQRESTRSGTAGPAFRTAGSSRPGARGYRDAKGAGYGPSSMARVPARRPTRGSGPAEARSSSYRPSAAASSALEPVMMFIMP